LSSARRGWPSAAVAIFIWIIKCRYENHYFLPSLTNKNNIFLKARSTFFFTEQCFELKKCLQKDDGEKRFFGKVISLISLLLKIDSFDSLFIIKCVSIDKLGMKKGPPLEY
jgi:hypothetical protein